MSSQDPQQTVSFVILAADDFASFTYLLLAMCFVEYTVVIYDSDRLCLHDFEAGLRSSFCYRESLSSLDSLSCVCMVAPLFRRRCLIASQS
jgi:hypothetical protein